ncbi:hypothetical protein NMQ14_11655 [Methyloversatilis sp. XJ19-13]|uniref:hypothetical protein n=1 Tax=Methyloversatilis sp. XJ19-13 TaxID=2963430 RepID=UPI00211CA5EC|nr:hypothetical protein [Methyloversatilis sp. XJ19-13]MCQ9374902.1 hypothetical protein [Methyloversatilis sp. XJ19-13]
MITLKETLRNASLTLLLSIAASAAQAGPDETSVYFMDFSGKMRTMEVMKKMDSDGDKMVSKAEFMKTMEMSFSKMDKNGDGMLDAKEWMGEKHYGGGNG